MRSLRWLLLVALILAATAVFGLYHAQRRAQRTDRRPVPPPVPLDTKTMAPDFEWGESANGQPAVKLFAKNYRQSADSAKAELEQIELHIYQKDGLHYDRVRSASAIFTTDDNKLYSPGDAEITLDVPVKGDSPHQLTSITAASINFDSKSGQAVTDKHVSFTFENGEGTCTGAAYDPANHTLNLYNGVVLNLRGKGPRSLPMKVESKQLAWNESSGVLLLFPSARLTRDQTVVNADQTTIVIKDGQISWIDAPKAQGTDKQPDRQLEYSADLIHVDYNDDGEMNKVTGTGNAKLISHATGSDTSVAADRVEMFFKTEDGESILTSLLANGNGFIESKPQPDPAGDAPDTKILKAGIFDLQMKPGGKDLDRINTQTPGTLEFLPNESARHRRLLKADRMAVTYGARNEIQSFHGTTTTTETYPAEEDRKKKKGDLATAFTSSKLLDATFDESGELKTMKQAGDFRYTEGERKAQADTAALQNDRNIMDLDAHARISDNSGSTAADHIMLDQNTGDFDARGHVATTRLPDTQKGESAMLDKDEPTQGSADRVTSANRNHLVHYAGNAVLWQTANRISADHIDIDRDKKTVIADGKVVTEFEDKARPVYTVVKSRHMVYTDQDRLATYTDGVDFWRPSMTVKSSTLKAWLNEQDSKQDSRLNHAQADGKVEIVQTAADRQRIGTGDHAEYYAEGGKVVLTGGKPQLNDTKRGNAQGEKLTYFTDDDRLIVDGGPGRQAQSHLHKKS